MIVKFKNTEIHIQQLKLGVVIQSTGYHEKFGHVVGFYEIRDGEVWIWVQFESHCERDGEPKKHVLSTELLNLVGH